MSEGRTGRRCTVCEHPEAEQINAALVEGVSFRNIGKRFDLKTTAIFRHQKTHIKALVVRAQAAREVVAERQALTLLERVEAYWLRIGSLLEVSEDLLREAADHRDKLSAIGACVVVGRELRESMTLLANLAGELRKPGVCPTCAKRGREQVDNKMTVEVVNTLTELSDDEIKALARKHGLEVVE